MSKKLSEINDDEMLLIGESIIDKESLLYDWEDYKDKEIWTTTQYRAIINIESMLDSALESEDQNMYEGWYEEVKENITEEDIIELQTILDKILSRSKNIAYIQDKKVEIDLYY